jgi:acyl carrier protein
MTEAEIRETIFKLLGRIAPEADFSTLAPDDNLRRTLDIDSFDALNFFIALHEELGVQIPESDYGQLNTLAELIRYLSARVG